MFCIMGLGNPGTHYQLSRHNVGFMMANHLVGDKKWTKSKSGLLDYAWIKLEEELIELVKPTTFMNRSGEAASYLTKKHPDLMDKRLIVIHDDLDIPLGRFKIQFGKGPRLHGGVDSIESYLKTDQFWRVRIGVEGEERQNKAKTEKIPGQAYVLQSFSKFELLQIQTIIEQASHELMSQVLLNKSSR